MKGGRPRFPLGPDALAEAERFLRSGGRSYRRAGEPSHPSLRDIARHLQGRRLVPRRLPPATLRRALLRAGVALPPHWRSRAS